MFAVVQHAYDMKLAPLRCEEGLGDNVRRIKVLQLRKYSVVDRGNLMNQNHFDGQGRYGGQTPHHIHKQIPLQNLRKGEYLQPTHTSTLGQLTIDGISKTSATIEGRAVLNVELDQLGEWKMVEARAKLSLTICGGSTEMYGEVGELSC